jgi:small nuclear ribonucleoprotein (snRNP)-like protein
MKIIFKTFFVLIILLVISVNARVRYIPIEDMPVKADFIIIGKVIDSSCRWDGRHVMIYTDYTIQVEESIKGKIPSKIVLSFAGGTIGEKTIIVTDTPELKIGERYLLFSYENNKYSVPIVGHEQGVFRLVYDKIKKKEYIVDYNWYQLELTDENRIIRGALTEIDEQGSLVLKNSVEEKKKNIPKPVIRDISGQIIAQDDSVFTKPKTRKRGTPLTRDNFVNFIKIKMNRTGNTQ